MFIKQSLRALPQSLRLAICFLSPWNCPLWMLHINELKQWCLTSFYQSFLRFSHIIACNRISLLFMDKQYFIGKDPLEEGMANHSNILAWRIPRTEEPGGLQSMGSHRVGHDWSALACSMQYFVMWIYYMYSSTYPLMDIWVVPTF